MKHTLNLHVPGTNNPPVWNTAFVQCSLLLAIATLLFSSPTRAADQSTCSGPGPAGIPCTIEYKTAYADLIKCYYWEYTNTVLPRIHVYHDQTTTWYHYYFTGYSGTNGQDNGDCFTTDGAYWVTNTDLYTAAYLEWSTGPSCTYSNNCTGQYLRDHNSSDDNQEQCNNGCEVEVYGPRTSSDDATGSAQLVPGTGWAYVIQDTQISTSSTVQVITAATPTPTGLVLMW